MWLSFQWWNILLVGLELPTPHKYMLVFSAELFYQVLGDVVVGNDRVVFAVILHWMLTSSKYVAWPIYMCVHSVVSYQTNYLFLTCTDYWTSFSVNMHLVFDIKSV
jgi:hypothetical protein